jgi:hypothetical protein
VTEGAKTLLKGTHGERVPRVHHVIRKDEDGRYQMEEDIPGPYAKWLPNVIVYVCGECNGGWMSRLENGVKTILEKFIFERESLQLTAESLQTLATWATKSWMAYALTRPAQQNPFTPGDYRAMTQSPSPFNRGRILIAHSEEPIAHAGIGISSWLLSSLTSAPDMEATPDNTGYAYLAVANVVLTMTFTPAGAPKEVADALAPQLENSPFVRRAWPDPQPHEFPLDALPHGDLANFLVAAEQVMEALGLPVEGLTSDDLSRVRDQYANGAAPDDLRRLFGSE